MQDKPLIPVEPLSQDALDPNDIPKGATKFELSGKDYYRRVFLEILYFLGAKLINQRLAYEIPDIGEIAAFFQSEKIKDQLLKLQLVSLAQALSVSIGDGLISDQNILQMNLKRREKLKNFIDNIPNIINHFNNDYANRENYTTSTTDQALKNLFTILVAFDHLPAEIISQIQEYIASLNQFGSSFTAIGSISIGGENLRASTPNLLDLSIKLHMELNPEKFRQEKVTPTEDKDRTLLALCLFGRAKNSQDEDNSYDRDIKKFISDFSKMKQELHLPQLPEKFYLTEQPKKLSPEEAKKAKADERKKMQEAFKNGQFAGKHKIEQNLSKAMSQSEPPPELPELDPNRPPIR
jgi:hypothetical protein